MAKFDSDGHYQILDIEGDILELWDQGDFLQLDLRDNVHSFVNLNKEQVKELITILKECLARLNEC